MRYRSIVVLTGAGISAESGLETFRDLGGLWERYRVEDVASPQAFARDPELVHRFYNLRRRRLLDNRVQPNAAHKALARLERAFGDECLVVTQNVDDLHERAGSRRLVHMHGELLKARCAACRDTSEIRRNLSIEDVCRACGEVGSMRPDVVWFGETPMGMERIVEHLARCDLFLAVGTSGQVYPAAGFVDIARQEGAHTLELNLERTGLFAESREGLATELTPAVVRELLASLPPV